MGYWPTFLLIETIMSTIRDIIEDFIPNDYEMIEYNDFSNTGRFRIVLDGLKNVDLSTTSTLAKKIKKSEIINKTFPDGVQLEITSPGIDSNLTHSFQFKKNIGRMLNVTTLEDEKSFEAKLLSANDKTIEFELDDGNSAVLNLSQIKHANVIIKF